MNAFARTNDPVTSHKAAASVRPSKSQKVRNEIYSVLEYNGPLTDEEIKTHLTVPCTDSGARTRRLELQRKGLVEVAGQGRTRTGSDCKKWGAIICKNKRD